MWYGPATTAVMYVEIGRVGAKRRVSPPSETPVTRSLPSTTQDSGAVTEKVNGAFRSGCSKSAKTRRASAGSYCV